MFFMAEKERIVLHHSCVSDTFELYDGASSVSVCFNMAVDMVNLIVLGVTQFAFP